MKEALKLALEALEANQPVNYCMNNNGEKFPMMQEGPFKFDRNSKVIAAIKEALAQPEQELVADPFVDIHDKRIGEMTAEQKDRAVELWLRNQKGWLPMRQREHIEALLRVIDGLRVTPPYVVTPRQRKPLTDEQRDLARWNWMRDKFDKDMKSSRCKNMLYALGLDDEDEFDELNAIVDRAIEAKLKEKNT